MRFAVLATDYDGTLATEGVVGPPTIAALERWRASGRKLVLVTGRLLPDLERTFPSFALFDRIVAENGATVWRSGEGEAALAEPPDERLLARLREAGVPFEVGRCILATRVPHEVEVLEGIRALGLELQVIFNKGAVMVLPPGVDKESGLAAVLAEMGLSFRNAIGVGDAENDHAFLAACECGVAVDNALPAVKASADVVTRGARGRGVEEIIEQALVDDLASVPLPRRALAIGRARDGRDIELSPAEAVLVTGASGGGKTTAATAALEQVLGRGYQVCLVDPEGDYEGFPGLAMLGGADRAPAIDEVLTLLDASPGTSVAVNLLAVPMRDRPALVGELLGRIQAMRARTGRPQLLALDEAHHLLPASWAPCPPPLRGGLLLVTVHPDRLFREVLRGVGFAVSVGEGSDGALRLFATAAQRELPALPAAGEGESLVWTVRERRVDAIRLRVPRVAHVRHRRKYAEGDVREKAFRFRGPDGRLDLRAQNLELFLQIADGVDDETWLYHLRRGDYARWFREAIKDEGLATEAERLAREDLGTREGRRRVREAVARRYVVSG